MSKLNDELLNDTDEGLLEEVSGLEKLKDGAYNIRKNGQGIERKITENVNIITKQDKPGINIYVKENTKFEIVHIPVIITESGLKDVVYNDFYIGKNAYAYIIAGCGIHNDHHKDSQHNGIHRFFLEEGARVKYVEKHYGEGVGDGKRILNPITEVYLKKDSSLEMESVQIKGVDSTIRETKGVLEEGANLVVTEKRSVAQDNSRQYFISKIYGNAKCFSHSECDAIIQDKAIVTATPEVTANNVDANLIHEAAIGKIAGEQITKLMTLGLSEEEAEQEIINGFLR